MRYVSNPSFAKLSAWYIIRGLRPTSPRTMIATERSLGGRLTYWYVLNVKKMSRNDTKTLIIVSPVIVHSGRGFDYVNGHSSFLTTMSSKVASSSLRATARMSVRRRQYLDSAVRSWVRSVSSTSERRAVHRGPTLATASRIHAGRPAPVSSINPPHSK